MSSRRDFLKTSKALGLSLAITPFISSCHAPKSFKGEIVGGNAALGHRLRSMDFGPAKETIKKDVVIVGGGVAGLSAARYLKRHNIDFLLIELETSYGGNSASGSNQISAFPWGAHYLPLPSNSDPELISFLKDTNVITGVTNGLPTYNEYYLCHDPKERLFINNMWQEGIVPHEGVPQKDRDEIQRFLSSMHSYKAKTGSDGKPAFAIPVDNSSRDHEFIVLDTITAREFLTANGYSSSYLAWYVNYCCADDFGTSVDDTSAWAMIHYFASRRGLASNAPSDAVLTWPEGNSWLTNQLAKDVDKNSIANTIVYDVSVQGDTVECLAFDASINASKKILAKKVIVCTPQFINKRIIQNADRKLDYAKFEYAPWLISNITTSHSLNERRGETLCWDNVFYGSNSLGYVNAMHQNLGHNADNKVITYYKPLTSSTISATRQHAHSQSFNSWQQVILSDLKRAHPDIESQISEMNVRLWGHGMITPSRNFIWSDTRRIAALPLNDRIFFAHSDLSGISIFEEAFYQGHRAAAEVLSRS